MVESTQTVIQQRPKYIQDLEKALFSRVYGTPDKKGVLTGGVLDRKSYPDIFRIPDYVQAPGNPLQKSVTGIFDTEEGRQSFTDRYLPYFQDAQGNVRYLPEAGAGFSTGSDTISKALADYFPSAKSRLDAGTGGIGAKGIYDTELTDAKRRMDSATGQFGTRGRADALFGDARGTIAGGLGQFAFDPAAYDQARAAISGAQGRFSPGAATQEFMNPYKEQVVDAALERIEREGAQRRQAGAAKAVGAGAFGGSRAGVQAAETERAIEQTKQQTVANLMSQGYNESLANAMAADENARRRGLAGAELESGLAGAEETARQQAFEAARARSLSGGSELGRLGAQQLGAEQSAFEESKSRMLKTADMYRSMGLSSAKAQARARQDEKMRSLEAGRLMGGLGQAIGQIGGAQADIGSAYGRLAGTSADIGRLYAGMHPADLGFMYELGGKERQYSQQAEDFRRKNILQKTQQTLAPYSYAQTYLTGSPSADMYGQFTQEPQPQPNPFLQGVGAYSTFQGLGS